MSKGIVLLAAGGTGGHVFPAEALAHTLKARGYQVHLVTDSRAERYAGKFPAEEIHVVPSATIGSKNPISLARSLWKLWTGLRSARRLITKLKPVAVVGFGGIAVLDTGHGFSPWFGLLQAALWIGAPLDSIGRPATEQPPACPCKSVPRLRCASTTRRFGHA